MIRLNKEKKDENTIIAEVSTVTVIGNVVLSVFKMFAGITGHSGAMISDAVHSLSDVVTTFIALVGVKLSKRAADREHPYGHERFECIASLILGILLLVTGISVGRIGIINIISGDSAHIAPPKAIALVAAIASIAVKEAMFWYTRHNAKLIDSAAFMADAWHHRSDALSSIGSMIGIGGAMLGFPVMDSIASVVICLFILKVTYDISSDAIKKMLDTSCPAEYEAKLHDYIVSQEGVSSIDMLRTRMFGNKVYIDLEIGVDDTRTFREAHEIAESVHSNVEKDFPNTKHIMIHVNPVKLTDIDT